jgi:hypothetical protein
MRHAAKETPPLLHRRPATQSHEKIVILSDGVAMLEMSS